MERRLLLDVVVAQRAAIFELLARKDEPLLVRRDALLVLDLGLDVLDRVARLDFQRDRLARQRLDKDLHVVDLNCDAVLVFSWFRQLFQLEKESGQFFQLACAEPHRSCTATMPLASLDAGCGGAVA